MKILRTILCSLVVLGCGGDDVVRVAPQPGIDTESSRFVVGERHRYRFDWNVSTQGHDAWRIDGAAVSGGIDMAGVLEVHVLGTAPEGVTLRCSFAALDRHVLSSFGFDALAGDDAAAQLVGHDAWLVVDPEGARAPRVHFDPNSPSAFRHLMSGLLVHLDLAAPADAQAREAVVPVGHGLAEVTYVRVPGDGTQVERTLHRLVRFDGVLGSSPADVDAATGRATIAFDGSALPARIDAHERVTAAGDADRPKYGSETKVSLVRESLRQAAIGPIPALVDLPSRDLGVAPDDTESRRELARRFAEDLTMGELELEVASVGWGLPAARGFMVRATGLLQSEPQLAVDVGELVVGTDSPRARLFALDVLASAGTPEAQAMIVLALGRAELQADPDYPAMLQRLSLLPEPTAGTVRFAIDLHATTRDPRTHNAVAYALGALSRRIEFADPATAAAIRERLREHLALATSEADDDARVAALAGLGNAGADDDLELLLAHVDVESDAVRMQMASSLRYYDDPQARAAMLELAADDAVPVAMLALSTLDTFGLGDDELPAFGRMIIDGETSPEATTAVVNVLARHRDRSPMLERALWVLLERETDFRRRLRLERLLGVRA